MGYWPVTLSGTCEREGACEWFEVSRCRMYSSSGTAPLTEAELASVPVTIHVRCWCGAEQWRTVAEVVPA